MEREALVQCGVGGDMTGTPQNKSVLHIRGQGQVGPGGARVGGMEPGPVIIMTLTPMPSGERGCAFCGGLGHRITDCPKLEAMQTKQVSNIGRKDYLAHSSMDF